MSPMSESVATDTAGHREPSRLDLHRPCPEIVGYTERKSVKYI